MVEEGELIRISRAQQHSAPEAAAGIVAADLVEPVERVHTDLLVPPIVEARAVLVVHWGLVPCLQSVEATALLASEAGVVASTSRRAEGTACCPLVSEQDLEGEEGQAVVLRLVGDLAAVSLAAVLSRVALSRKHLLKSQGNQVSSISITQSV